MEPATLISSNYTWLANVSHRVASEGQTNAPSGPQLAGRNVHDPHVRILQYEQILRRHSGAIARLSVSPWSFR
jgi:hypothetical protein